MGKENQSQRRIDLVFKRKRYDANELEEDPSSPADHPLPLVELEHQQHQTKMKGFNQMNMYYLKVLNSCGEIQVYAHKFGLCCLVLVVYMYVSVHIC